MLYLSSPQLASCLCVCSDFQGVSSLHAHVFGSPGGMGGMDASSRLAMSRRKVRQLTCLPLPHAS
jgi:hypothetical protein